MSFKAALSMFACLVLSGCGNSLPIMDWRHADSADFDNFVRQVGKHVRCELRRAVVANFRGDALRAKMAENWAAKIALNMKAIDEGTVGPNLSVLNAASTFIFSPTASLKSDATREMTTTYFITFAELLSEKTSTPDLDDRGLPLPCLTADDGFAPIGGDLGIEQTLESSLRIADSFYIASDKIKDGPFDTISHHVNFTIIAGATATPTWKLQRVTADTSGTLLGANRTTYDDLLITMGPTQLGSRKLLENENNRGKGAKRLPLSLLSGSSELDQAFFTERLRGVFSTPVR